MHAPSSRRGLLNCVMLVILVAPLAALGAGVGAFLGMSAAVAGWGPAFLGTGTLSGAGVSLLLLFIWVLVFVVGAGEPKTTPLLHAQKVASLIEEMKGRGVAPEVAAPILFRLWWSLGFQTPPPLFLGIWASFAWSGVVMTAIIASAASIYWWSHPNTLLGSIWLILAMFLAALAGALAYGAVLVNRTARKYELPAWDKYAPGLGRWFISGLAGLAWHELSVRMMRVPTTDSPLATNRPENNAATGRWAAGRFIITCPTGRAAC